MTHCPGSDSTPGLVGSAIREQSANWAGYVIYRRKASVTCVEGAWVHPKVTCPSTGKLAVTIWVGMDGVNSSGARVDADRSLEQVGTQVTCEGGRRQDFAWREVYPSEPQSLFVNVTIQAGDSMWARVLYQDGVFSFDIADLTTGDGRSFTEVVSEAPRLTAEWIVEAPATGCPAKCVTLPLLKFPKITFTGAFASIGSQRASISDDHWLRSRVDMLRAGVLRASTSTLTSHGTSFVVTWRHR